MRKIEITTHRGGSDSFPENSLAAFLDTWSQDAIPEMDVQKTSDGTLLLCHDETLDRTTHNLSSHLQKKPITQIPYREIEELRLSTKNPHFSPPLPLLEEVLQYLQKDPKKQIVIDNKTASLTKEILPLIEYYRVEKQACITSSVLRDLEIVRTISPMTPTQLRINTSFSMVDALFTKALTSSAVDSILFILHLGKKTNTPFHLPEWYIQESSTRSRKKKYSLSVYHNHYTELAVRELVALGIRRFTVDSIKNFTSLLPS